MRYKKHPVIILGGGPAGACTAMYLLRRGIKPVIVERDAFPSYHVGEISDWRVGPTRKRCAFSIRRSLMRSWKDSAINSHMRLSKSGSFPAIALGFIFTNRLPQSPAYLEL